MSNLANKMAAAKAAPGMAHLILTSGPFPICELCGGEKAPIVNGQHIAGWCTSTNQLEVTT